MSRFRLLFFDLDGTLLDPERRIHPATLATLGRLMERGVRVALATGRSPRSAAPYLELLRPNAPSIHFNGAMIRDASTGEVLSHRRLSQRDACTALRIGEQLGVHANLYLGEDILVARRTPASEASEAKDGVPHKVVGDLATHLERVREDPTKIMFIVESGEPSRVGELGAALSARLAEGCSLVNSEIDYLELLPHGVSKGAAAVELAARLGVDLDGVVAFGDNENDAELLACAGVGVAMGNGRDSLRAQADVVIGSNEGDAIARFLEELYRDG